MFSLSPLLLSEVCSRASLRRRWSQIWSLNVSRNYIALKKLFFSVGCVNTYQVVMVNYSGVYDG